MHELGVVFYVIDDVERVAKENDVEHIHSVTLEIGEVSSVIPDYLLDCWKWAVSKEIVMKDAELRIEQIKAETFCENCGKVYGTVEHGKICPYCGSDRTYLKQGNEFILKNIVAGDCESYDKTE